MEGTNSKNTMFAHFQEYHRNRKKKDLYGFGGAVTKLETFVRTFNHVSRVITSRVIDSPM